MAINDSFMLPTQVRTMEQMADLLAAEQTELDRTQRVTAALENQLTISASTELLPRHERLFGIPVNVMDSLETRRARVLAKLNTRGITTTQAIRDTVKIITGRESEVTEHFDQYAFTVLIKMLAADTGGNMQELMRQIERIKPAHLLFSMIGTFDPVFWMNRNVQTIYSLRFLLRVIGYGTGTIALNGARRLDGGWALNQTFRGLRWERMALRLPIREKLGMGGAALLLGGAAARTRERTTAPELRICAGARNEARAPFRQMACGASARQDYRLTGEMTRDTMWTLSGACRLDGTKKLNAAITKEEI